MGKINAAENDLLESVQRRYTKEIDFGGKNLQYFERLQQSGLLSVQRERQKLILIQIGNYIRNRELDSIGVAVVRQNARTGIRIEPTKQVFLNLKIRTKFEKSFSYYAPFLFNNIPYDIKLLVQIKDKYDIAIKKLCHNVQGFYGQD